MKLLTVNVHSWLEESQMEKMVILAETIVEKDYDIVALQEVNQLMSTDFVTKEMRVDNFGLLLTQLINQRSNNNYSYFWSNSHIGYDKYEEGIAILTKLPVYDYDAFYCSRSNDVKTISARKIVGITVGYNNQLIDCYSCHINLPDYENESQVENVRTIIEHQNNQHLKILMGDFNVDAISNPQAYNDIKELGLYDTYNIAESKDDGITASKAIDGWQGHFEDKRLDYIFVNKDCQVVYNNIIFNDKNKPIISDHYGVEVELIF